MTQEEQKNLLLKDLCARLPYNSMVEYKGETYKVLGIVHGRLVICKPLSSLYEYPLVEEVKLYLLPLSSMTEKQKEELRLEHEKDVKTMANCLKKCSEGDTLLIGKNILYHAVDWCNKNHFDYRNLIDKNLAIDCTDLNIY